MPPDGEIPDSASPAVQGPRCGPRALRKPVRPRPRPPGCGASCRSTTSSRRRNATCRACCTASSPARPRPTASLRDNREAFGELGFVPRVLADVSAAQHRHHAVRPGAMQPPSGSRRWAPRRSRPTGATWCFARAAAAARHPDDPERLLAHSAGGGARRGRRPPGTRPTCPASRRGSRRWWTAWRPPATTPSC